MSVKCSVCGAPVENAVCSYCGARSTSPTEQSSGNNEPLPTANVTVNLQSNVNTQGKSKTTALVLCILFGYLGVHNFYVGKIGMGILYFFTYGILGIGWIIDIIKILTGSFKDNTGLPLV